MRSTILSVVLTSSVLLAGATMSTVTAAYTNDFSTPVTLSPTPAAGTWYVDRFAPAGFASDGTKLVHTIAAADVQGIPFYNTQGRKYDVNLTGAPIVSVDLFVPSTYSGSTASPTNLRAVGFWGTGFDSLNNADSFPILAFRNTVANPAGFYSWDGGAYVSTGVTVNYDAWNTLSYVLNPGTGFDYFVNGSPAGSLLSPTTVSLANIILQGGNFGADYSIAWDNVSAVPEPSSLALIGVGAAALLRRRRRTV